MTTSHVRKLERVRKTVRLTLPVEMSSVLIEAGVERVQLEWTADGLLITPYREPELPAWARKKT